MDTDLFGQPVYKRPNGSLLKWIGSKYRMAEEITSYFPHAMGAYYDVFLGGGSILATVAPPRGVGSDTFAPLIEIWTALQSDPELVKTWYEKRWTYTMGGDKRSRYEEIKTSYNSRPNGADFLYISRACYGGVIRFRKHDGYMSTPVGVHTPILPSSFAKRVDEWHHRVQGVKFLLADYTEIMEQARPGDMIYCDPPYSYSQAILYGAQNFDIDRLLESIKFCKKRGVCVALSIDGTKKSGRTHCDIQIPEGLFERQIYINAGRSMLRRFQMNGKTMESELVSDRLLLTY